MQRELNGRTYQISDIWTNGANICTAVGTRHDHSELFAPLNAPKHTHAAVLTLQYGRKPTITIGNVHTMLPKYQEELYIDVNLPRC